MMEKKMETVGTIGITSGLYRGYINKQCKSRAASVRPAVGPFDRQRSPGI